MSQYIKIQLVPHRKHITPPLKRSIDLYCLGGERCLLWDIYIHTVHRRQNFSVIKQVVHIEPLGFEELICFKFEDIYSELLV
jgi:hypothetical protein